MGVEIEPVIDLWPLLFYIFAVVAVVGAMLGGSYVLGEKHRPLRATEEQFESGVVHVGDAQMRFSAQFYLIAIFFVIFDLEAVFIFAWAVAFREAGWAGYIEILIFIAVLMAALIYVWRIGALDWRTQRQRIQETKIQSEET